MAATYHDQQKREQELNALLEDMKTDVRVIYFANRRNWTIHLNSGGANIRKQSSFPAFQRLFENLKTAQVLPVLIGWFGGSKQWSNVERLERLLGVGD